MKFVRRILLAVVPIALLLGLGVAAPAAQAAAPVAQTAAVGAAYDSVTGQALAQWECKISHVCFWDDFQGKGRRCMWENRDDDWTSGPEKCSWATSTEVKSVYNRGTSASLTGVVFYRNTGYNNRIGCTKQGQKGDLAGTYQVRSHQWTNGRCG
ncbi:peptidase inhibitor family I36 [Lentzea atacamensis]|uniref:Peptidase inhibitor family I36 n=1 Tax=Lentzea atacamensis TaxID=531938 RepID=A0ABX9EHG9_9PSEU|nr:peptidase inhibitor family I36 protein [Lentzea atacamensis]RAS69994.1 peptidase inhibitor family I36 [Lentzea atacamensis]